VSAKKQRELAVAIKRARSCVASLHRRLRSRIHGAVETNPAPARRKLGQMGDVVKVKPGYAATSSCRRRRRFRASKDNRAAFEKQRVQLEAQNIKRREEAERLAERVGGISVVIIRQAGESGSLYGSVSARDIARAPQRRGFLSTAQVVLEHPIKTLGCHSSRALHPEVSIPVTVNVARSPEEAERQARGERAIAEAEEEDQARPLRHLRRRHPAAELCSDPTLGFKRWVYRAAGLSVILLFVTDRGAV